MLKNLPRVFTFMWKMRAYYLHKFIALCKTDKSLLRSISWKQFNWSHILVFAYLAFSKLYLQSLAFRDFCHLHVLSCQHLQNVQQMEIRKSFCASKKNIYTWNL